MTIDLPTPLTNPPPSDPSMGWGHSLARGAPGVLLLHAESARATGDWRAAHSWASASTRTPVPATPGSSLFRGALSVAFALHTAAHPGYADALRTLDQAVTTLLRGRLDRAHTRIDNVDLPALGEFDLVSGLTGFGVLLLHRSDDDGLRAVLSYLVRLTEPVHVDGENLPGWWTANGPADHPDGRFPGGHGNLGMAHGVSGPLALLVTAMRRGITVDGHANAVTRICAWLETWRQDEGTNAWWPPWVTRDENRTGRRTFRAAARPSWCYGTPGIGRALQLAAIATSNAALQDTAEAALLGCATDGHQLAQITEPGLCHGWAGLHHAVNRAAADARTPDLAASLPALASRLNATAPPQEVGLLDGRAGVELVRHTIQTGVPPATEWDACMLLNG
ncbi:lanthionine synthetase-like protein [Murinocardiopsis flavida]|uniref:Lanthionine synthetase-like protein n=1 Tax=Murinocardiopsis flavida TaxID=645275 RepID=A0A2P8CY63_9ACTN|nr:lanthionine synthetase C family protein [Murinocardiopsis flavida]PSK89905.1 lanthionine synthetase-like protein [Murinocardiopsis flavida]